MLYTLTEEEYSKLNKKAMLVNLYAEELKRLNNIPNDSIFTDYVNQLQQKRWERDKELYYGNQT